MTPKIRRGLEELAEYGRCWLEADGWQTPESEDEATGGTTCSDMEAALEFLGYPIEDYGRGSDEGEE